MFSPKTLDFLFENRLQDSRAWFEAHKVDYRRHVLEPLRQLVEALTPSMLEIDARLTTEPKVDKTICRIWRDTRYSHDKSLYRDTMWIIFKRGKMHGTQVPGLYFEVSEQGFSYGAGFYHASTGYMNTLRRMVLAGTPAFTKADQVYRSQQIYQMNGVCFKRPRFTDQPQTLRLWLERRNIGFYADSHDYELLFSDQLADKLIADFRLLAPIYHFLLEAAIEELKNNDTASSSLL